MNLAWVAFYLRERRAEFNAFRHEIVPVLGILFFIPGWLTAMGIPVLDFISPLPFLASYAGIVVAVAMLIGVRLESAEDSGHRPGLPRGRAGRRRHGDARVD